MEIICGYLVIYILAKYSKPNQNKNRKKPYPLSW
jgi:hypothetical protein